VVPSGAVFGFSLSELIVVIVVALVVIGPKDLPKMLRKLGQYSGKLRRMASDLRAQSGIDDALRTEGLADDIAEIRKLARGELDAVQRSVVDTAPARAPGNDISSSYRGDFFVVRDREYPRDGADSYGALPDNAIVYAEGLPKSKLARDPLYMLGDPDGVVPEPEPPPAFAQDVIAAEHEAAEKAHAEAEANAHAEPIAGGADGEAKADASAHEEAKAETNGEAHDPSQAETQDPPAVAERPASEAH
jgi:sec-independent protein translocase protein TatB